METFEIKYSDKLCMTLDEDNEPIHIICIFPILAEGNNRIVYDMEIVDE